MALKVARSESLCELTPLCGTLNAVSHGTIQASTPLHGGFQLDHSLGLEHAFTEASFDEARSSALEGCCPSDGVASAALCLLTAAVTPTMLSLPLAFSVGGLPFAVGCIVFCIAVTMVSVRILALASISAASDDYETVTAFFFGATGRWFTRLVLLFYNFGCGVVYLRFIMDSLAPLLRLEAALLPPWLSGRHAPVAALCVVVALVIPLTFSARLSALRTKGLVSNLLVGFIVCAVVYRYAVPNERAVLHSRAPHHNDSPRPPRLRPARRGTTTRWARSRASR